jgi:hypothetical protein
MKAIDGFRFSGVLGHADFAAFGFLAINMCATNYDGESGKIDWFNFFVLIIAKLPTNAF